LVTDILSEVIRIPFVWSEAKRRVLYTVSNLNCRVGRSLLFRSCFRIRLLF